MPSESRPYINAGIEILETLAEDNRSRKDILTALAHELSFRKTSRARKLARDVTDLLARQQTCQTENGTNPGEAPTRPLSVSVKIGEWDAEQKVVIELDEEDASLVEAGPGSGKTAVACARVARLIEDRNLAPAKILLISFTRAAVKELRERIESFAKHPLNIAGLNIATLDSLTWQVVRGVTGEETRKLLESYEGNIERFVDLLKEGDAALLDYVSELQHVVIDEGQDLVAIRAELVVNLIRRLPPHCGVTVFADSAQAIYGFTDDTENGRHKGSTTLAERIYSGELEAFQSFQLNRIYRTKDERLKKLYRLGRSKLIGRDTADADDWKEMKQNIRDLAHRTITRLEGEELRGRHDSLVLFRTRAEVLMQSSMLWSGGVGNKLRMSGLPPRIHPWIGRVFGEFDADRISQSVFEDLWKSRIGSTLLTGAVGVDEAWTLLMDNAGERNDKVDVRRLREILSRETPPVDFIMDEKSLPGPVIGTIHASKGREAERVFLMMPPDDFIDSRQDGHVIAEEERVLFVGATRAKKELVVGSGFRTYAKPLQQSDRTYRLFHKAKGAVAQMEIGRRGDVDATSQASGQMSENDASALQAWLWATSAMDLELVATYDRASKTNVLRTVDSEKRQIGTLSQSFARDLFGVAEKVGAWVGKNGLYPSGEIKHIRMVGCRTVVVPPAQREKLLSPWRRSGFLLVPVIAGFTMVYCKQQKGQYAWK